MFVEGEQMFGACYGRTNVLRTARRRGEFFSKGLFLCKSGAGTTAPAPMCRYPYLPIQQQQQYVPTTVCMYVYCVCTMLCMYTVYVCSTQRACAPSPPPLPAQRVYRCACACVLYACSWRSSSHGGLLDARVQYVALCMYLLCLLDVCIVVDVCCC